MRPFVLRMMLVSLWVGAISCDGRGGSSADGGDSGWPPPPDGPTSCPAGVDVTFGQFGWYEIPSGVPAVEAVVAQSDGQVVVVGEGVKIAPGSDGPTVFGAVRLLQDGRADPSFGQGGTAAVQIAPDGHGTVSAAALQSDGKLVVVGRAFQNGIIQWLVARWNRDGALDTTFGSGGVAATPLIDSDPAGVVVSDDGSIIVAGTVRVPYSGYCCDGNVVLAKYDAGGGLDPTFGGGGFVRTLVGVADGDDYATAVVLQPDGHIVVAGFAYVKAEGGSGARQEAMLLRYTANGALDADFGSGGIVLNDSYGRANALALQSDGKLIVSLSPGEHTSELVVARYTSAGALDPTFGSGGAARIQLPLTDAADSDGLVSALFPLADGTTFVAGPMSGVAIFLAKLTAGGAVDATFANDGVLMTGLANGFVAATSDGKAVVVGHRPTDPFGAMVIERVCL